MCVTCMRGCVCLLLCTLGFAKLFSSFVYVCVYVRVNAGQSLNLLQVNAVLGGALLPEFHVLLREKVCRKDKKKEEREIGDER